MPLAHRLCFQVNSHFIGYETIVVRMYMVLFSPLVECLIYDVYLADQMQRKKLEAWLPCL